MITDLRIKDLTRDEGLQPRVITDDEVAGEYALAMRGGAQLPEPVAFDDGEHTWLADGFHTVRAAELNREQRVRVDVRRGSRRDALLYAVAANATHGLRRKPEDLRKAVRILLEEVKDEDPKAWPNTRIAELCRVSEGFVRKVKAELRTESNGTRTAEVEDSEESAEPEAAEESLTADEEAALAAMGPVEREAFEQQAKTNALDERLASMESIIVRIEKRLGEDDLGKSITNDLKLFRVHARHAVGWEHAQITVTGEEFRERMLIDLDRLRKLNNEMPGERQRMKILDRVVQRVKEAA